MTTPSAVRAVANRTPLSRRLGTTIRESRSAGNLRQADVADACATTQQTVARWEAGLAVPDLATLITLADLLGFSIDELRQGSAA